MSKKRKTNHENYNYVVESIDKFDWTSKPTAISDLFNTEKEAVNFMNDYCLKENITSETEPFQNIVVTRVPKE